MLFMMIAPWFTLPLLGSKAFKRFLMATLFTSMFSELLQVIAKKRNWWHFHSSARPKFRPSLAFTLGPEFLIALWVLKAAFGRFSRFLLINAIVHVLFAYPGTYLLKRLGIVSFARLSSFQFFLLLSLRGILLYYFQLMRERLWKKRPIW